MSTSVLDAGNLGPVTGACATVPHRPSVGGRPIVPAGRGAVG